MIAVADAGPLIHLAAIGRIDLLHRLFGRVLVPRAVHDEIVIRGAGLPGSAEVAAAEWVEVASARRTDLVDALLGGGLHRGESEAIALAVERGADLLLIDERQGRLTASSMGIPLIGTLGVLVAARERGEIEAVGPLLEALRGAGLWLSDELVARVLEQVGEGRG
jgi:predicted nucleic acid-binding protein